LSQSAAAAVRCTFESTGRSVEQEKKYVANEAELHLECFRESPKDCNALQKADVLRLVDPDIELLLLSSLTFTLIFHGNSCEHMETRSSTPAYKTAM